MSSQPITSRIYQRLLYGLTNQIVHQEVLHSAARFIWESFALRVWGPCAWGGGSLLLNSTVFRNHSRCEMTCFNIFLSNSQLPIPMGQFRYFKIQMQTIGPSTRPRGINPANTVFHSSKPRAGVYRPPQLNLKISKSAHWITGWIVPILKQNDFE